MIVNLFDTTEMSIESLKVGDRFRGIHMMTWIIEEHLNPAGEALATAAREAGCKVIRWNGMDTLELPEDGNAIFQGSLGGCVQFAGRWEPGVLGTPEALACSNWLPILGDLALNQEVVKTIASEVGPDVCPWPKAFVRPDSALKPFSGRVISREDLSPIAIDFGFYFEDPNLPVFLSPAVEILSEWRFVAVDGQLIAQSGYTAENREAQEMEVPKGALEVAEAAALVSPSEVVVIDVCQTPTRFAVVEFNLFSGADLYGCDPDAIVKALW